MGLANHGRPTERSEILGRIKAGQPLKETSANSRFSYVTVKRIKAKEHLRAPYDQHDLPRSGAPKKFSENEANHWYRRTRRDPDITYAEIVRESDIGRRQIYNRLHEFGGHYHKYECKKSFLITREHARKRREWVAEHRRKPQSF
jgi:transposase